MEAGEGQVGQGQGRNLITNFLEISRDLTEVNAWVIIGNQVNMLKIALYTKAIYHSIHDVCSFSRYCPVSPLPVLENMVQWCCQILTMKKYYKSGKTDLHDQKRVIFLANCQRIYFEF